MSKTKAVVVGALLLNLILLGALYFNRRTANEAAEARAAMAARNVPYRPLPGAARPDATAGGLTIVDGAPEQSREAALRSQSKNNLRILALAMHNYADVNNGFPAGTHPNTALEPDERLSWIADVLPYLDQAAVFNSIDFTKGWKDPVHERLTQLNLPRLRTPAMSEGEAVPAGITQYVGLGGVGVDGPLLPATDPRAGVFGYDRITSFRDIRDGTSNTLAVTEVNSGLGPWIAGGKSTVRSLTAKPYINGPDGIGGPFPGMVQAAVADGSVRTISEKIDPAVLEALITINGGEPISQ